jgi:hypothetical protein
MRIQIQIQIQIQIHHPVNKAVSWPTYALGSVAHGVEGEEVVLANLELISAPGIITHMSQWVITRK